jgi:hypothetical protein
MAFSDLPLNLTGQQWFTVKIQKSIWDGASPSEATAVAILLCEIALPFPPSQGLEILMENGKALSLRSVRWDISENIFFCTMPDDFIDEIDIDAYDFDELITEAQEEGWLLVSNRTI